MSGATGPGAALGFVKGHAYGNDFLFIDEDDAAGLALPAAALVVLRASAGFGAAGAAAPDAGAT